MSRIIFAWLIASGLLVSCDILGPDNRLVDPNYPASFRILSQEMVDSLESMFGTLNSSQFCGQLNRFGFTDTENCYQTIRGDPVQKSEAIEVAMNALLRNQQFTNVTDTSDLSVSHIFGEADSSKWLITFHTQQYQSREILDTRITVYLNSEGVYNIYNHWYPSFYLPDQIAYDSTDAKIKLLGKTLTFPGYSGKKQRYDITYSSLNDAKTVQKIVPHISEYEIEMRLTWQVPVSFVDDMIGWYVYIDAMTGEEIKTVQLFRT